ncbi:MAG: PilN domain-containing protein [Desulfonatronovibrio sp.]
MIKINLLPHAKRAKSSDTERQVILFVLVVAIIASGIGTAVFWSGRQVNKLQELVEEREAQRQLLLTKVGKINQLEKELEEIDSNISAIKTIRLKQQLPVIYVDEAVRYVPGEEMWFEALNLSRQGVLDIRGVALDNQTFAAYVDELRDSDYIRSVSTQRTSRRQVMDLDLVEFQFQIRAGPATSGHNQAAHED